MKQEKDMENTDRGKETPYYVINSVKRTLEILDCFSKLGGASVTEISNYLKLNKSTVHRFLATMKYAGYLEQNEENQKYRLSIKLFEIGNSIFSKLDIGEITKPIMYELAELTGETVILGVLDSFEVIYIDKCVSQNTLRMDSPIGARDPAYCTALGKALLAFQLDEEINRYLQKHQLRPQTANTIVDPYILKQELIAIRAKGFAINREELSSGINCIAAPIINNKNKAVAAISISAPKVRMTQSSFEKNKQKLIQAAQKISKKLGAGNIR